MSGDNIDLSALLLEEESPTQQVADVEPQVEPQIETQMKFKDCPPKSYDFLQLNPEQQQYCKGKGLQKLTAWNKGLKTNKCPPQEKADMTGWDEKRKAECTKFWNFEKHASNMVVYLVIAMLVCDVLLFTELFIHNETYILGMHITRIIFFVSIVILATINFAKGYRQGPVNAYFDVIAKFITFAILLAYTITMGVRYQNAPSTMGILMIIGGVIFTLMTVVFCIWGIVDIVRYPGEPAMLSQTQFMFWAVFGILVSIYTIIKHKFMGENHDNTPLPPTPMPH